MADGKVARSGSALGTLNFGKQRYRKNELHAALTRT
jgi:hypothetical protein